MSISIWTKGQELLPIYWVHVYSASFSILKNIMLLAAESCKGIDTFSIEGGWKMKPNPSRGAREQKSVNTISWNCKAQRSSRSCGFKMLWHLSLSSSIFSPIVTHGFALTWQFTSRVRAGLCVKLTKHLVTDNHDQGDWQSAVLPPESSRGLPKYRWHLNYDFDHNHEAQIRKIFSFSTSQRSDWNHVKVLSCYPKIQARFAYTLLWLHSGTIGYSLMGEQQEGDNLTLPALPIILAIHAPSDSWRLQQGSPVHCPKCCTEMSLSCLQAMVLSWHWSA